MKMASALPKEPELCGLMDHAVTLLRSPDDEYLIIARVSVKTIHDGRWEGTRIPEIGIVAVELATGEDEDLARDIMTRAKDQRYERRPRPAANQTRPLFGDDE